MKRLAPIFAAFMLMTGVAAMAATMRWPDLLDRPHPKADARISYGADPLQHGDLWLPKGAGPFPTVLMVHGGCWQTEVATADIMDWIAADLRRRGIAVWNVEYRGADRPGGGYPGTFLDVAKAADALRGLAPRHHLKLDRLVAVGHSAGGHLALWLAARPALPAASPLHAARPLPIAAAVSLGGLPDLEAAAVPPGDTCGSDAVPRLIGPVTLHRPDPYADTSPARLRQPAIPLLLVSGTEDHIAPPSFAAAYARRVGGAPRLLTVSGEGHVELIAPESRAWHATASEIERLAR